MSKNIGLIMAIAKAVGGSADPAVIEQAVTDWLDDHPEATTTVQDGSITEAKLAADVLAELGEIDTLKEAIGQKRRRRKTMKWNWKEWAIAALIRAIRTFAQTFAGCIAVGAALEEVQWLRALSVSGVAFVLSILTALGGLPEVQKEPIELDPPDAE